MEKGTKIILAVLILVIILLVVFGAYYLTQTKTGFFGKANTPETYSLDNSYLFASPITASAGGNEKIKVSAFLLSGEGRGVSNKRINLVSQPALTISEVQPETDAKGQAIFEIFAPGAGRYIIQAAIEGNVFPQSVTVTFN